MMITGEALIGGRAVRGNAGSFQAVDPARREAIDPAFHMVDATRSTKPAAWPKKHSIPFARPATSSALPSWKPSATQILELGDDADRARHDRIRPAARRLEGERGRTVGQLKLFADLLREGSWADLRIDSALPERHAACRVPTCACA
jgi:alpha-ketoglutaric semialdehyde dehydrogenase